MGSDGFWIKDTKLKLEEILWKKKKICPPVYLTSNMSFYVTTLNPAYFPRNVFGKYGYI